MRETIDVRDESKENCPDGKLTEEQFLEQFAALEENLAILEAHMHSMAATVKRFSGLARDIRRSTCPSIDHEDQIRCRLRHETRSH